MPLLQLDYGFYSDKGELTTDADPAAKVMVLVGKEMLSGYPFAAAGLKKGKDEYLIACVLNWIKIIGSERIEIQCDDESPIKALISAVKDKRTDGSTTVRTYLRNSPAYSHESNGGAEREVQSIGGLARTLIASVRARFGIELRADNRLMPWIFRHCAFLEARFAPMSTRGGDTAYYVIRGHNYQEPLVQFGEVVRYRLPQANNNGKLVPRWEKGVWGWP